jgi:hypothetical protein
VQVFVCFIPQTTAQLIDEHQEAIDELLDTNQELVALCSDNFDVSSAVRPVEEVASRYETLKQTVRQRLNDLEVMFKRIFTDVSFNTVCAKALHFVRLYLFVELHWQP